MDKIAIVILNWNGVKMLTRFLPNVLDYSRDEAVVYVADNASTDNSLEVLRMHFPDVRIVELDKNWGFADGYNKALEQIEAKYYILLNSDVEVTHNWLTPLTEFMDSHPEAAACQPKILSEHDRDKFEYAGACGGYIDCYGYPFCRGRIFDTVEYDNGQYDDVAEVMWATGACMMIRSSDFKIAGGFDPRFFAHCEEIDLCWRLNLIGRKVFCVPDSSVYHIGGGTLPKNNPMKTFLNFRNNLTMLYKNLPDEELERVMLVRTILDYVAAAQALLCGRIGDFKAIINARKAFNAWMPTYDELRDEIQSLYKVDLTKVIYPRSILMQYYVKRRKKYSQLVMGEKVKK